MVSSLLLTTRYTIQSLAQPNKPGTEALRGFLHANCHVSLVRLSSGRLLLSILNTPIL